MTHHYEFSFSCPLRIKLTCHLFGNVQFRQQKTDCICCTDLTWLVCCRLKQNDDYQVLVHQGFTNYLKNANGNFNKTNTASLHLAIFQSGYFCICWVCQLIVMNWSSMALEGGQKITKITIFPKVDDTIFPNLQT